MVAFGQSGSNRAQVVVFKQSCCIGATWLYLGKSGGTWAKWLYSSKSGCIRAKVDVFGQRGCIRAKWLFSG